MRKKQKEMQENGGSLGYLSLEVSSSFTQLTVIAVNDLWTRCREDGDVEF